MDSEDSWISDWMMAFTDSIEYEDVEDYCDMYEEECYYYDDCENLYIFYDDCMEHSYNDHNAYED